MKRSISDELMEEIRDLGEGERRRVLEYARSLSERSPHGVAGATLIEHLGGWTDDVADEVEAAIEEGCQRVNLDGW